jgi:hypothetical protein
MKAASKLLTYRDADKIAKIRGMLQEFQDYLLVNDTINRFDPNYEDLCNKYREMDSYFADIYLARHIWRSGRLSEAISLMERVAQDSDVRLNAYFELCKMLRKVKNFPKMMTTAAEMLGKCDSLSILTDTSTRVHLVFARCLEAVGELD